MDDLYGIDDMEDLHDVDDMDDKTRAGDGRLSRCVIGFDMPSYRATVRRECAEPHRLGIIAQLATSWLQVVVHRRPSPRLPPGHVRTTERMGIHNLISSGRGRDPFGFCQQVLIRGRLSNSYSVFVGGKTPE